MVKANAKAPAKGKGKAKATLGGTGKNDRNNNPAMVANLMGDNSDEEPEADTPAASGREEEAEYDFMWMRKRPCALIILSDGLNLHCGGRSPSLAWGNSELTESPLQTIQSKLRFVLIDCLTK